MFWRDGCFSIYLPWETETRIAEKKHLPCKYIWAASSEFGTYRLCQQRRFWRDCADALIQAVSQEEPSDRKPDPWPLWMAGHAQLKCVMTECSKTQISLTGLIYYCIKVHFSSGYLFARTFLLLEYSLIWLYANSTFSENICMYWIY